MVSRPIDLGQAPVGAREKTIARLRAIEPELRRRGVAGLRLFGSMARGQATRSSDIDLLVRPVPGRLLSLLDLSDVRLCISDRLGREASVVVEDDVAPEFMARIAADLVTIY